MILLLAILAVVIWAASSSSTGTTLHVSATASGGDGTEGRPYGSIDEALVRAAPGDQVVVSSGEYPPFVTRRAGTEEAPIRITGNDARIVGTGDDRVVEVSHSYVTLESLDISKGDILVAVVGARGVRLVDNVLHDANSECVRLRDGASNAEIAGNRIERCGLTDFDLDADRKNGEGIYIGVAPEQLEGEERAAANENWIHDNRISVPAECVDVKEGSERTIVERNECSGGEDPNGGGFSSRGNRSTFRDNASTGHAGAGIRLGGDDEEDGVNNEVVNNRLTGNAGYGLKVERFPQGRICGNQVSSNRGGETNGRVEPDQPCEGEQGGE